MKPEFIHSTLWAVFASALVAGSGQMVSAAEATEPGSKLKIAGIDPPEKEFFSKRLDFHGIPIKAHQVVADEALYAAYDRLSLLFTDLLTKQPMVISNLVAAGAELHIIGRDQVTTDLPEWRHDKGVPRPDYNGLTRDQRTRGMGGRLTSCGEENLLKLEKDRYRGRDICLHEFSHNILDHGCPRVIKERVAEQRTRSLAQGLWQKSYAGSNVDEFFAELTMWYFGTHGDLSMTGPKPENGREGLQRYDPEAFGLLDDFYSGRMEITKVEPGRRRPPAEGALTNSTAAAPNQVASPAWFPAVSIRVDASRTNGELKPIWRFFGADEPNYAYMKNGRKLLAELGNWRGKGFIFARTICSPPAMAPLR